MRLCARCARHVRGSSLERCPFCAAAPIALAAAALGASVALASCGGVEQQSTDGGVADAASDAADASSDAHFGLDGAVLDAAPDVEWPDSTPVPVYGAPPPVPPKPSRIGR
jgi:hypothetical protein